MRNTAGWVLAISLVAPLAFAADPEPTSTDQHDAALFLVPLLAPKAPVVDGRLNEDGWGNSAGVEHLYVAGSPKHAPSRATEVYVTIDAENLFVAFRCGEPYLERRKRTAKGRDVETIGQDDSVTVQLQPPGDAKGTYYEVTVSSSGAVALTQHAQKTKAWNAGGIQVAARDAMGGWVVELRVPFKALGRGTPEAGEVWRANFSRHIATVEPEEHATWARLPTPDIHQPEHFAELRFE
ncbi:MAG: carbohydrate-binding family 9-like protein [bacterium]